MPQPPSLYAGLRYRKIFDQNVITVSGFKYGVINAVSSRSIPRGAANDSLNWKTKGDKIELRRGQAFLGTSSVVDGLGKTSSIKTTTRADGVQQLFGAAGKKAKYFSNSTQEWVEIGSDILGANVIDSSGFSKEQIFMSEYVGLAGNQVWLNSPNSAGFFKILVANPADAVNQYSSTKNFYGDIKIDTNRTLLWSTLKDKTGLYGSYIDNQIYTTVTNESIGTGDGVTTSYVGVLAFKAAGAVRTCFGVAITAGGVSFTDDYCGVLTGSDGSTGTINYATGAYTLTFITAPAILLAITASYQWEDSTNKGIADFTKSGSRLAGEGFVFRQDEGGGAIQNIGTYAGQYFCFHLTKTWALTITSDDTNATNLPYRQKVGIPGVRAFVETGDGVYYVDSTNPDDIRIRLLTYQTGGSQQIVPVPMSKNLKLNSYLFDQSAGISWGDLVLFSCRTNDSTVNNRVLVYDLLWKSWDIMDYNVNCLDIFNGTLVAGDSLSNNYMTLFSGFDDLGSTIDNYWIGNLDAMGMDGLKKIKKFYIEGEISVDQSLDIYIALDGGAFSLIGTILGTGSYVDTSQSIDIGAPTLGSHMIGGGSVSSIFHYERQFAINTDKFEFAQIKYVATKIGYVSVRTHKYWDVRNKGKKVPVKYRG